MLFTCTIGLIINRVLYQLRLYLRITATFYKVNRFNSTSTHFEVHNSQLHAVLRKALIKKLDKRMLYAH